jgi:dihydroorotase-like cyclic amidohydrolase
VHLRGRRGLRAFLRPLHTYGDLLASRTALAEAVAIAALGVISQRTGLEVHSVHLSSALGLAAARDAGRDGARPLLETCPQYLWLTDEDAARRGPCIPGRPDAVAGRCPQRSRCRILSPPGRAHQLRDAGLP